MATKSYLSQVNYGIKGRGKPPPGMSLSPTQIPAMPSQGSSLKELGNIGLRGYDVYQKEKLRQKNNDAENLSTELMKEHIPQIESAYLKLMSDKSARNTGERFSKTWGDLTDDHINSIRDDKENDFEGNPESWNRVNSWLTGYFLRLGSQGKRTLDTRSIARREKQYNLESKSWIKSSKSEIYETIKAHGRGAIWRFFDSSIKDPPSSKFTKETSPDAVGRFIVGEKLRKDTKSFLKKWALQLGWNEDQLKEYEDKIVKDTLVGIINEKAFDDPSAVMDNYELWSKYLKKEDVSPDRILNIMNLAVRNSTNIDSREHAQQFAHILSFDDPKAIKEANIVSDLQGYLKDFGSGDFNSREMKQRWPQFYLLDPGTVATAINRYENINSKAAAALKDPYAYKQAIEQSIKTITEERRNLPPLVGFTLDQLLTKKPDWDKSYAIEQLAVNHFVKDLGNVAQELNDGKIKSKGELNDILMRMDPSNWALTPGEYHPGPADETDSESVLENRNAIGDKIYINAKKALQKRQALLAENSVEVYNQDELESTPVSEIKEIVLQEGAIPEYSMPKWRERISAQPHWDFNDLKDGDSIALKTLQIGPWKDENTGSLWPYADHRKAISKLIEGADSSGKVTASFSAMDSYLEQHVPAYAHQALIIELFSRLGETVDKGGKDKHGAEGFALLYDMHSNNDWRGLDALVEARSSRVSVQNSGTLKSEFDPVKVEITEWMMEHIGQYMPVDQRAKYEAMVEYTINKAGASLLDDWTVTGVTRELWGRYIGLRPGIGGYSTNVKGILFHTNEWDLEGLEDVGTPVIEAAEDSLGDLLYRIKHAEYQEGEEGILDFDANPELSGFQVMIDGVERTVSEAPETEWKWGDSPIDIGSKITNTVGRHLGIGAGAKHVWVFERSGINDKGLELRLFSMETKRSYAVPRRNGKPLVIPYKVWSKWTHTEAVSGMLSQKLQQMSDPDPRIVMESFESQLQLMQGPRKNKLIREFAGTVLKNFPKYREVLDNKNPAALESYIINEMGGSTGSMAALPVFGSQTPNGLVKLMIQADIARAKAALIKSTGEGQGFLDKTWTEFWNSVTEVE